MPRWTAQEKEAYRTEVMQRVTAAMPSVMQEYASINWAEELKGYHTEHEYYPEYIHAPIHGLTDSYTNPQSCLAWDAAMDAIIPLSHKAPTGLVIVRYAVANAPYVYFQKS
ncbi:hypothetical protein, partial [Nostoc sp. UHCC 0251]|uniref:hypothetical protein n=1 Tax=Nostoc sp. UHCC 0251 TaxID=3110240 RepID=UPI002B2050AD